MQALYTVVLERVSASFVVYGSTGTCLCKFCIVLERVCAIFVVEGSLEVKLPTIWTDEKQSREEAERRERSEGKKMELREKVGKSRNTVFFQ